jgi:hypothetical protein
MTTSADLKINPMCSLIEVAPNYGKKEIILFHSMHKCFTDLHYKDPAFIKLKKTLGLKGDTGEIINTIMEKLDKSNSIFKDVTFNPNSLLVEWAFQYEAGFYLRFKYYKS